MGKDSGIGLCWKTSCPCCFDKKVPEPKCVFPTNDFADVRPKFREQTVTLKDCKVLDNCTGDVVSRTVKIYITTVHPVVTPEVAAQFKFLSSDTQEHRGYLVILPEKPAVEADGIDEVWHLVRTSDSDGSDSTALSFNRIGCLDSMIPPSKARSGSVLSASKTIGKLLRRAATYRQPDSGKAPKSVDRAIKKKGLRGSSLRVNRVGGPNGHAGGFTLQKLKAKVCSPFISHCIPRNQMHSVITCPVVTRNEGGVTTVIPFYITVKKEKGLAVVCPPHCAIPRHGFVSTGSRVLTQFKNHGESQAIQARLPQSFLRIFTASTFTGARVLRQLGISFPQFVTSEEAVERTLGSEDDVRCTLANDNECGKNVNGKNLLDSLARRGNYTSTFDSVGGHQDVGVSLLENKACFAQGTPDPKICMEEYLRAGRVPPGALAYPRYKVATVSYAFSDVELHCLDNDLHLSSRQLHVECADSRSRRGAWTRQPSGELLFYPEGYAVLDW
jgi:hypothetical protein